MLWVKVATFLEKEMGFVKKSYIEPMIAVEAFCLNENIAACAQIVTPEQLEMYESMRPNVTDIAGCLNFCPSTAEDVWDDILFSIALS